MTAHLQIVHITDLHVGKRFVDYRAPRIRGFSAVDISVMQALAAAAPSARPVAPSDARCCIVSGDLTAYGSGQEFANAETYISATVVHGGVSTGLEYGVDDAWDGVLGNHDIWGGRLSLVAWYAAVPKKEAAEQAIRLTTGVRRGRFGAGRQEYIDIGCLRVRFYMLDSTLPGWRNVFARGRVSLTDLESLKACVAEDEAVDKRSGISSGIKEVLRIAVLHHPSRAAGAARCLSRWFSKMVPMCLRSSIARSSAWCCAAMNTNFHMMVWARGCKNSMPERRCRLCAAEVPTPSP